MKNYLIGTENHHYHNALEENDNCMHAVILANNRVKQVAKYLDSRVLKRLKKSK